METLGTLVDKLSIVNLKLWHQEDRARDFADDDKILATCKRKIDVLNIQRNDLMAEVDAWLYGVLNGKVEFKPYNAVKSYGTQKRKG